MDGGMAEWAQVFRDHCPYDKSHLKDIFTRFPVSVFSCGKHLREGIVRWSYVIDSDGDTNRQEFLDFIDGNGFKVVALNKQVFHIYPIYDK